MTPAFQRSTRAGRAKQSAATTSATPPAEVAHAIGGKNGRKIPSSSRPEPSASSGWDALCAPLRDWAPSPRRVRSPCFAAFAPASPPLARPLATLYAGVAKISRDAGRGTSFNVYDGTKLSLMIHTYIHIYTSMTQLSIMIHTYIHTRLRYSCL